MFSTTEPPKAAEAYLCDDVLELIATTSLPAFLLTRQLCRHCSCLVFSDFLQAASTPADFSQRLTDVVRNRLMTGRPQDLNFDFGDARRVVFAAVLTEVLRELVFVAKTSKIEESTRSRALAAACVLLRGMDVRDRAAVREAFAAPYRTMVRLALQPAIWLDSACELLDGLLVTEFVILYVVITRSKCLESFRGQIENTKGLALMKKAGACC